MKLLNNDVMYVVQTLSRDVVIELFLAAGGGDPKT